MITLSEKVRKYGAFIGKTMVVLFLAILISGVSTGWSKDGHHYGHGKKGYEHGGRGRYDHGRRVYHPHYYPYYYHGHYYGRYYGPYPYPVYVPPPVYYAPPPPPWGITIFAPPIIIHP